MPSRDRALSSAIEMFWRTGSPVTRPCSLRSSGTRPMPALIARLGVWPRGRTLAVDHGSRRCRCARSPKMARASSVRPAPTSPATPTISPRRTENEMSRSRPRFVEVLHLQDRIADLSGLLPEDVADVAADHHPDELAHVRLGDRPGADIAAVAEHGDAVAEAEDLLHAVRDVDDAEPLPRAAARSIRTAGSSRARSATMSARRR